MPVFDKKSSIDKVGSLVLGSVPGAPTTFQLINQALEANANDYAIKGENDGDLLINAKTGKSVSLKINDVEVMALYSDRIETAQPMWVIASNDQLRIVDNNAPLDEKIYLYKNLLGDFSLITANDAFDAFQAVFTVARTGVAVDNVTFPNGKFITQKVQLTPEGGIAVLLTNKTGGNSVKGEVVTTSSSTDNAVEKIVVDVPNPIGVFYDSGIADGAEAWVVVQGIADVYFIGNSTRGHIARGFLTADGGGYITGQALSDAVPTSPFADDKHFYELGHVIENRTGAGLAKCVLHYN